MLEPVFAGEFSCRILCVDFHEVTPPGRTVDNINRLRRVGYVPVHVYRTDVTFGREGRRNPTEPRSDRPRRERDNHVRTFGVWRQPV